MKWIHLTDTHLVRAGEILYGLDPMARLQACVADINRHHADADLVVITGDLTHYGDAEAFGALREALAPLEPPLRLLPGNHDTRECLREAFPGMPFDVSSDALKGVLDTEAGRLLFLDTTQPGTHAGWYDEARQHWLAERLRDAQGRDCFLFMHHPPFPVWIPSMDRIGMVQADAFAEVLAPWRAQVRHLFFGHVHRPISGSWRGIPFSTLRATSHQVALELRESEGECVSHEPPAYAVVLVSGDQVVVHTHYFLDASPRFSEAATPRAFWEEQQRRLMGH